MTLPTLFSRKTLATLLATVTLSVCVPASFAGLDSVSLTQNNISLTVQTSATSTPVTYNLGSFTATLKNSSFTSSGSTIDACTMRSIFTVNTGTDALPSSLFDHLTLHWYQQIDLLPMYDAARYKNQYLYTSTTNKLPITDPPNGGWDYMYTNPVTRATVASGYSIFVDDAPFYYTRAAELAAKASTGNYFSQPGIQYLIEDQPADRSSAVDFSTYLVAEVTDNSVFDSLGLLPGQMLVLGGFTWHNSTTDLGIDSTFTGAASHLASINTGLSNAGFASWDSSTFSGWTAVSNSIIEIPEPASLCLLAFGALTLFRRSPKNA